MSSIRIPAREIRPGDITPGGETVTTVHHNWGVVYVWLEGTLLTDRADLVYSHGDTERVDRDEAVAPLNLSERDCARIFQALCTELARLEGLSDPRGHGAYRESIERTRNLRDVFARH